MAQTIIRPIKWRTVLEMLAAVTVPVAGALATQPALRSLAKFAADRLGPTSGAGYASAALVETGQVVVVVGLLWVFYRATGWGSLGTLGLQGRRWGWLPLGLFLTLVAQLLVLGGLLATASVQIRAVQFPGIWITLLAIAKAGNAGWLEEIFCRGILLQGIERAWSRAAGVVISTIVFVIPHAFSATIPMTGVRWAMLAVAGLLWAWAYYAGGRNLWWPIGLHWGLDMWFYLAFGIQAQTRGALVIARPAVDLNGSFLAVDLLVGAVIAVLWAVRRPRMETERWHKSESRS